MQQPSDAELTVKSALLDAIASTAHLTRLTAGNASEALLEALMEKIKLYADEIAQYAKEQP